MAIFASLKAIFFKVWRDHVWAHVIAYGLASAIGAAGLFAWQTFFAPPTVVPAPFNSTESHGMKIYRGSSSAADLQRRNVVAKPCADDIANPKLQLAQIRDIPSRFDRDISYSKLTGDAACLSDEQLALELFAHTTTEYLREEAVSRAIGAWFLKRDYDAALRWARYLKDDEDYGFWVKRIIEARKQSA